MTFWKLILRSIYFFRTSNFAVILGTMVATAVLTGALIVGDSMKFSLNKMVYDRLGKTEFILYSSSRSIRSKLASEMADSLNTIVSPIIQSRGILIKDGGQQRINNVQILGVDKTFGDIGNVKNLYNSLIKDEVIISKALAKKSGLKTGDNIILRIQLPNIIPLETSLSLEEKKTIARPFKIKGIAGQAEFGSFNLNNSQVAPDTVFLSISYLSKLLGIKGRANILLFASRKKQPLLKKDILKSLKSVWQPSDASLVIRHIKEKNTIEIKSERIFIDPPIRKVFEKTFGQYNNILTYFVNSITYENKSTPYSFISSSSLTKELKDNEIIINEWLKNDLNVKTGDILKLSYYVINDRGYLKENDASFIIKEILSMKHPLIDKDFIPNAF